MEILAVVLLCGFATWSVASLLHTEDAFEWLRKWIGIKNDESGYPSIYPDTFWGKTFNCFWCLSLVVGLPITVYILWARKEPWLLAPFIWLSARAVAVWLEKQIMRTQSR